MSNMVARQEQIRNFWVRREQVSGRELSVCLLCLAVLRQQTGLWNFKLECLRIYVIKPGRCMEAEKDF